MELRNVECDDTIDRALVHYPSQSSVDKMRMGKHKGGEGWNSNLIIRQPPLTPSCGHRCLYLDV
jgi:hypothetical protein